MISKYLIIDGLNLFVRTYCAVPLMDSNGSPIGGVIGTLRSVKNLITELKPTRVVFAWDGVGGSLKRRGIYKDYKAGRKPRVNREYDMEEPDEARKNLIIQYNMLREYLGYLGVTQLEVGGAEADDLIALLCQHTLRDEMKVIASSDRDFLQLVGPSTIVYSPSKKLYYGSQTVLQQTGVMAENYIFMKALCGDKSDNVKGIGGLGPKTVVKLFPFLAEREVTLKDVIDHAQAHRAEKPKYEAVCVGSDLIIQNVELMQLSTPVISPEAVRAVAAGLAEPRGFSMSNLRLAMLRDSIQLTDTDLFSAYRDAWLRRQNLEKNS